MKTINNLFFATITAICSLLWVSLNLLSCALVTVCAAGQIIVNLCQCEDMNGKRFKAYPQILRMGKENWVMPYHFMMAGVCAVYFVNPTLAVWVILRIFIALAAFECLGIILCYIHKWTDEAGRPLWTSVEYGNESCSCNGAV